jgi:FkbM family methyltransferase
MRIQNNIVLLNENKKNDYRWRKDLPVIKSKTLFFDENNKIIDPFFHEKYEQYFVHKWLKPDDIVLELGGRYGVVACTIDSILANKKNHVVVEPDKSVINALKKNKKRFGAKFYICDKAISDKSLSFVKYGIGSYTEESTNKLLTNNITFSYFMNKYKLNFNVLIADCEGCIILFLHELPSELFNNLNMIIFEKDRLENKYYEQMYKKLIKKNFIKVDSIRNDFQQVWIKNN